MSTELTINDVRTLALARSSNPLDAGTANVILNALNVPFDSFHRMNHLADLGLMRRYFDHQSNEVPRMTRSSVSLKQ